MGPVLAMVGSKPAPANVILSETYIHLRVVPGSRTGLLGRNQKTRRPQRVLPCLFQGQ
jgi:hypothetical protein